jgi:hypothetical protein
VEPVLIHAGRESTDAINVDFPVVDLSGKCSASALAGTAEQLAGESEGPAVVLLEYSGYGYARNGAPRWLVNGLRRVCGSNGSPLITVFHELYATQYKPWKRSFWTVPFQYYVASRLATHSEAMTANWHSVAQWLRRRVNGTPVRLSPSFSNVGEPESLTPYSDRKPYAVCFGGSAKKEELYERYGSEVILIMSHFGIERVIDIGPDVSEATVSSLAFPVERKGILPKEEVSTYLENGSLGLLNYGLHCLRKSGIWGSYAAHALPTVITAKRTPIDGLNEREHFLLAHPTALPEQDQLDSMSKALRQWYNEVVHSKRAAQRLVRLIERSV